MFYNLQTHIQNKLKYTTKYYISKLFKTSNGNFKPYTFIINIEIYKNLLYIQ